VATGTHELGLWRSAAAAAQPRARQGRFVCVRHTPARRRILLVAAQLRRELGMPDHPRFPCEGPIP